MGHDVNCIGSWAALEAVGDDPAARARWLERAIVGLELPAVITELAAISGSPGNLAEVPPETVRSWLGPDATAVLERGLAGLPRRKLDELFRRPGLLVGLQELAFTEGGAHWNGLVRQDDATNVFVRSQRDPVLGRLGLSATARREHVSPPGIIPAAAPGRTCVAATAPRPSTSPRRLLFMLSPLAAAAALLVAFLSPGWRQPEDQPRSGRERVSIVKALVPVEEGDQPDFEIAPDQPWPAHPWQGITVPPTRPVAAVNGDVLDTLAAAQEWSRRLRGARNLSAAQVRDAAERAQEAVTVIAGLAASGSIGFNANGRSLVMSTCQTAKAQLVDLQAKMDDHAGQDGGVTEVQADVARVLADVEGTLVEACSPPAPEPVNPVPDAAAPVVDHDV